MYKKNLQYIIYSFHLENYLIFIGPFLVNDLQNPPSPLKKSRFNFMILNGMILMILIDGLCIEKNEKPKINNFPIFSF